jgi:predicted Kef-type K+ transport protein
LEAVMPFDGVESPYRYLEKFDQLIDLVEDPKKWVKHTYVNRRGQYCLIGALTAVGVRTVGMSLDIRIVGVHPLLVLGTAGGMVLLKLLVIATLSHAFGLNRANSLHTGLLLGPGGEFAFVIVSMASGEHLLAPDAAGVTLFVTALTMASIPLCCRG